MASRIVLDATPLLYPAGTGIARATAMLIKSMLALKPDFDFVLFGRRLLGRSLQPMGPARFMRLRLPRRCEPLIQKLGLVERMCKGELYHATDHYMPLKAGGNAVATIHDVMFLARPETQVDFDRLARFTPPFVRRCRRVITGSQHSKTDIVNRLDVDPDRICVIPWGVNRDLFQPAEDYQQLRRSLSRRFGIERPYFLAVSCSTGRKNTPRLLEAYCEIARRGPIHDLVLVWDAPPEIRQQYEGSSPSARIRFIGRQSDTALRDLYCGAVALAYPSRYEGFGLPVLEAMSCGTPVITSHASSLPEVAGEAAVYVDPEDTASIVSALECFENNGIAAAELKDKSLLQSQKFSWDKCARDTLGVYAECLVN